MKCLDHIDMAVMAGAVTVLASAIFFSAYLGVEREPLVAPAPISAAAVLQEELGKAMNEAVVTPARVIEERERTQVTLGEAIMKLTQVQVKTAAFIPDVARSAAETTKARREFLEGVFKLPADWRGAEFLAMERQAEARGQEELGRMMLATTLALAAKTGAAEEQYGRALLPAARAIEREAIEPAASHATILAAAGALTALAEQAAPAPPPEIAREPSWGFGSIGDGAFIPFVVLGAGAVLLLAAGAWFKEGSLSTRSVATYCDEHGKHVVVEWLISDDTPYEVARCSAFNNGPVTCDKRCLKWAMAQAA